MQEHTEEDHPVTEGSTSEGPIYYIPDIVAEIQASFEDPTHEGRTRVLIDTPDCVTIVSGYYPGEGEELHAHPTANTLLFLAGEFYFWIVDQSGTEMQYDMTPGMMVRLDRKQPHRVQAKENQTELSIVMVTIIQGMSTSNPSYSIPVSRHHYRST
jgi:quercetin dioxygenase-like cupin family protein